jgi:WD40 repeat protein
MTGIFISYSRKDSQIARKLIAVFKSIDLDVWVDWEDIPPAAGWLDQIFQGIEQADAFVFLISPDSAASEVCNVELAHAHKNAKRIIPILVRDEDPKKTAAAIRELNWIFLRETDDFDAGLEKIKVAINLDLDWLREHSRLQVRALEWDRKKDPSLLLRGGDLRNAAKMVSGHEGKDPVPSELQKMFILLSRRNERLRTVTWIATAFAILVMALLSWAALDQRREAVNNAAEAQEQKELAEKNEDAAIENARAALIAKAAADKNAKIANAQRSAARAQIYQSRTGGLFTSTLLGIDSYLRNPSLEAEGILRENVSLLPIPVAQLTQNGAILRIETSPDGETFVFTSADGAACLMRFESGESLFCATSPGSMLDAAVSPDGEWMVTGSSSGEVLVLNTSNGAELKKFNLGVEVFDVNINPEGSLFALARSDGRITLYKRTTFEFAGELSVHGSLRVTAFSPDGEWFAAGSDAGSVTFWNLSTGEIISSAAHRDEVRDLLFSPDSFFLLSGGADNSAVITSPLTGEEVSYVLAEDWVEDVDYSPDGSWFVTASNDFRIRVWDSETGEERLRLLQDSIVSEVKISPDGLWIASTGSDRTVRVWSAANGAEMFQIPLEDVGNVIGFSGDSVYLVAGDSRGNLSLWDISSIKANAGYMRFDDFVGNIAISPNGDWFSASTDGQVWALDPGLFPTLTAPPDDPLLDFDEDIVHKLEANQQGTSLAITTESGKVVLLNPQGGGTRTLVNNGPLQSLIFSADGKTIYLGNEDGLLQFRSLDSGENGVFWQAPSAIYSLAISGANSIAVGLEDRIVVLGIESQTVLYELDAPGRNVLIEFAPTGGILASATSLGHTYLWREKDAAYRLEADIATSPLNSLSFDPGGQRLYLGETDQILILDAQTGSEVNRIRQKGPVTGLAFSPDGETLYTASLRAVQIFDISSLADISGEDIITTACSRLTRNFTAAEWTFFFEDDEYITLCPSLLVP